MLTCFLNHENLNLQQIDILISKNQALQILYLKHYVYITTLYGIATLQ